LPWQERETLVARARGEIGALRNNVGRRS